MTVQLDSHSQKIEEYVIGEEKAAGEVREVQ